MLFETNKDKGRAGMALGIAYFGANGYTINIPLNDTQWYDFIAEKNGKFYTVQCKATGSADGTIDFRSKGGTKGQVYDVITEHDIDFLFCIDKDKNMYCIPKNAIPKNQKSIALRTKSVNQGFNSYQYLVTI